MISPGFSYTFYHYHIESFYSYHKEVVRPVIQKGYMLIFEYTGV